MATGKRSWLESANAAGGGFPLASLPYCAFVAEDGGVRLGVGIGDCVLDLRGAAETGLLHGLVADVAAAISEPQLNALMACAAVEVAALRSRLTALLQEGAAAGAVAGVHALLRRRADLRFAAPVRVGNYTDFYASRHHALRVGEMFRPTQPLLPNYAWVPIGYHGRASSVVVSGTEVVRPRGQVLRGASPVFAACAQLDYEVEMGAYVGRGNGLGDAVAVGDAEDAIFGISLLNDWSARDLQAWESQPLGPFLSKSFLTSVSPWVVPMAALAPFRCALAERGEDEPVPLGYLQSATADRDAFDVRVEVSIATARMQREGVAAARVSVGNLREMYWSFRQMLTHHTCNGCNLQTGDLLASGTISGAEVGSEGCLLEKTRRGTVPLQLPNGEERKFLEDGDAVVMHAFCESDEGERVSFGECRGLVVGVRE